MHIPIHLLSQIRAYQDCLILLYMPILSVATFVCLLCSDVTSTFYGKAQIFKDDKLGSL